MLAHSLHNFASFYGNYSWNNEAIIKKVVGCDYMHTIPGRHSLCSIEQTN